MKLMSLGAALIIAAVALNAPPTPTTRPTPKPAAVPVIAVAPFRGAVLFDVTASREEARIAASLDDFAPIFDRLRMSGGEIGFGLIREDSDHPLVRCYIPTPPDAPTPAPRPANGGNLFVNANNRKREDAERKKYEAKRRAWEAEANARINAFIVAITPFLEVPGDAPATDLTAAVERGDLMLAEPSEFTNATTAIILITDGLHNATAKTTPTMRSNARVAIVNGVGLMGALAKLTPTPLRFESTAAAVRYFAEDGGARVR
ncbi:MAG TPA: hypothetical protein VJ276_18080 [Thermoanaerobaculia bacterium]|nr:hypothetical protein [Thermoanaerobaculia bacterium]